MNLESCPFCAETAMLDIEPTNMRSKPWMVFCVNCLAQGPPGITEEAAARDWNERIHDPEMFYKEQTMVDIQEQLGMLVNEHRKVVAELKRLKAYSKFLSDEVARKATETNRLRLALESIADNTCCEGCQEAAKVAQGCLGKEPRCCRCGVPIKDTWGGYCEKCFAAKAFSDSQHDTET